MDVTTSIAFRQAAEPAGNPTATDVRAGEVRLRAATDGQPTFNPQGRPSAPVPREVAQPQTRQTGQRSTSHLFELQTQLVLLSTPGASPVGVSPDPLQRWTPATTRLRRELFDEARQLPSVGPVWIGAGNGATLALASLLRALAAGLRRTVPILQTWIVARIEQRRGKAAAGQPHAHGSKSPLTRQSYRNNQPRRCVVKKLLLAAVAALSVGAGTPYGQTAPQSTPSQGGLHQPHPPEYRLDADWCNG